LLTVPGVGGSRLPVEHAAEAHGHGREELRTIRRAPATAEIRARHPDACTVAPCGDVATDPPVT